MSIYEKTKCLICRGNSSKLIFTDTLDLSFSKNPTLIQEGNPDNLIMVYECNLCSFARVLNIPRNKDFFTHLYNIQKGGTKHSLRRKRHTIFEHLCSTLKGLCLGAGSIICDVGCGDGTFLKRISEMGVRGVGIEINKEQAFFAKKNLGLEVHNSDLIKAPLKNNFFDALTFIDVLEHIPNFKEYLQTAHQLLKVNGYLLIKVPNFKFQKLKYLFLEKTRSTSLGITSKSLTYKLF